MGKKEKKVVAEMTKAERRAVEQNIYKRKKAIDRAITIGCTITWEDEDEKEYLSSLTVDGLIFEAKIVDKAEEKMLKVLGV